MLLSFCNLFSYLSAKESILKAYDEHDTLIIIGETGSGKTTRKNEDDTKPVF